MNADTSKPFNLVHDAWLPVKRRSGAVEQIRPSQITEGIEDDPFVAFAWPRPDFNGAAHEFMIGLLTTAAASEDEDQWAEWWRTPPSYDVLQERFSDVADAFNLDGPGPRFMQDFDPLDAEDKPVAWLLIDAPAENTIELNRDLFVKRGSPSKLCRPAAAMALFTLNSYAPEGGPGYRTSLRGGGPMTTLIVTGYDSFGTTLWGRLWPNVETREQIERRASNGCKPENAKFPWLKPTRTSKNKEFTTTSDVNPLQVYWGMPRRIRLQFEKTDNGICDLTASHDTVCVKRYSTIPYGTNYSDGFEHPLTPHYRKKQSEPLKLPVHPKPEGISYRLWPGVVVQSKNGLQEPAQVVRQWQERVRMAGQDGEKTRLVAFGYNMAQAKARAWVEGEIPLWQFQDAETNDHCTKFVNHAIQASEQVVQLLTGAIKSALYKKMTNEGEKHRRSRNELPEERFWLDTENSFKRKGDYPFVGERFYRDTEAPFYEALGYALNLTRKHPDEDDPTMEARQHWVSVLKKAALRLFDEYAPSDGLEGRDMHRYVKARFHLANALGGRGKTGNLLFEQELGIPSPEKTRKRKGVKEAA